MNEFCQVVYLPRTQGISFTKLRNESQETVNIGIIGCSRIAKRFPTEASFVNGVNVCAAYDINKDAVVTMSKDNESIWAYADLDKFYDAVDAVYIATPHLSHYEYIKKSLDVGKHVLYETPLVLKKNKYKSYISWQKTRMLY